MPPPKAARGGHQAHGRFPHDAHCCHALLTLCLRVLQSTRDVALALALARCDAAAEAAAATSGGGGGSLAAYEQLRAAAALLETHRVGTALLAEVHGAMEVSAGTLGPADDARGQCVYAGGVQVDALSDRMGLLFSRRCQPRGLSEAGAACVARNA